MPPRTRYAKSGDINIAYQSFGAGALDLIIVPGFVSNVDMPWLVPKATRFLERLGGFARVVMFDECGTGQSILVLETVRPAGPDTKVTVTTSPASRSDVVMGEENG